MSMDIRGIFDAITPENIKNIPLISTAMAIFIENIEENATVAESIKSVYKNEYDVNDSPMVQEAKLNLRKGLLDVYMTALYQVLTKAQSNDVIRAKFEQAGITGTPFFQDVERIINDEYFITNKAFKEKLGTDLSIKYAYNLTKYLETAETANDLNLYEVKPFHFRTDGSILKEMYENIVKPLAHPIGFTYEYNQIVDQSIQDLFGIDIIYNIYDIEIRNLDGHFDIFTEAATDVDVKADFLTRKNPITGRLFTTQEYNNQVVVWTNKVVDTFVDKTVDDRRFRSILFTDGTYLQQYTNPIEILYISYADFLANNFDNVIKEFSGHWSLYVNYASDYTFGYTDNIDQIMMEMEVTKIKENNGGIEAQKYYNLTSGEYAFHVGGDVYLKAPGVDESKKAYTSITAINAEIANKFTVTVVGKTSGQESITVSITDSYNHTITNNGVQPDGTGYFSTTFNTYELSGDNYTVKAIVERAIAPYSFTMSSCGLNNFNHNFYFTVVDDYNHVTPNTLRVIGKAPANATFDLKLTDSLGGIVISNVTVNGSGNFTSIINIAALEAGSYRLDATIYSVNGKPLVSAFYKATDLKTHVNDVLIRTDLFTYNNGAPNFNGMLGSTILSSTDQMAGSYSTTQFINKHIGELATTNTYAVSDKYLLNYMVENGITNIANLPSTLILNGAFIEGNKYDVSNIDFLPEEETFINAGRKIYPIGTSDFIVMTSSDYVQDDIFVYGLSTTGYYLYSEELVGYDYYFYSNDGFYLVTYGDNV